MESLIKGEMNIVSIDSLDDPLLDAYRDVRNSRVTRRTDWFVAEGKLVVQRLLRSDYVVRSVLLSKKRTHSFGRLIPAGMTALSVDHEFCSRLVGFKFHSGVMACADRKLAGEQQIMEWPVQVQLVCCPETALADNLGSILRMSAAFRVRGVIAGPRSVDPFSRRSVRVSMGNIFGLDIFQPENLAEFLRLLKNRYGFEIVAAEQTASAEPLERFKPSSRMVLMFGNEGQGLGPEWLRHCDRAVQIEMSPSVDSLNVSTAAAILLYDIRQRIDEMSAGT